MTDRVPGAPGQYQVVITPDEFAKLQNGESAIMTLTRDDQPITVGTPYSKAAVLPDELAALICPSVVDPTPADAYRGLKTNIDANTVPETSDYKDYLTISSKYSVVETFAYQVGNLVFITIDLRGPVTVGANVIGRCSNNIKMTTYGAARTGKTGTTLGPGSLIAIPSGELRAYASNAGDTITGTLIFLIK